ncbi:helix-turn-helix domain-containing protein [Microseira wollei]|uniref:HTH cro/C1-type domain-containing protein n=1 Tax=Microseira wollei NIES-4236 TaxID=2530354 RepID=A0AAV3XFU6_9CYAN|nr:helix-turn-helix transcriptional regulator [Microseira wollei]GET40745.1 hypothetical protein MiSe_55560 [Microseira wollei NIES-4236]
MARTPGIRVSPEHIQTVKQTLYRRFPRQIDLAEAVGVSRSTVTSYFNGKPVSPTNFIEISNKLGLNWQAISYRQINKFEPNPLLLYDEMMQEYAWLFEQRLLVILISMLR